MSMDEGVRPRPKGMPAERFRASPGFEMTGGPLLQPRLSKAVAVSL